MTRIARRRDFTLVKAALLAGLLLAAFVLGPQGRAQDLAEGRPEAARLMPASLLHWGECDSDTGVTL